MRNQWEEATKGIGIAVGLVKKLNEIDKNPEKTKRTNKKEVKATFVIRALSFRSKFQPSLDLSTMFE